MLPSTIATAVDRSAELIVVTAGNRRAIWWFAPDHQLALEPPAVSIESATPFGDDVSLVVRAHNLVRDLTLLADRIDRAAESDQQLITILPGEPATIVIRNGAALRVADLLAAPVLRSAYSAVTRDVSRPSSDGAR